MKELFTCDASFWICDMYLFFYNTLYADDRCIQTTYTSQNQNPGNKTRTEIDSNTSSVLILEVLKCGNSSPHVRKMCGLGQWDLVPRRY